MTRPKKEEVATTPLVDEDIVDAELMLAEDALPVVAKKVGQTGLGAINSKYSVAVHNSIIKHCRKGLPLTFSAAKAGIHGNTAKKWHQEGQDDPEGVYGAFALAVEKAQADFLMALIDEWREVGSQTKQWTSFATMAERLYPEHFVKKAESQTNVTVNVGILEQRLHQIHEREGKPLYTGG